MINQPGAGFKRKLNFMVLGAITAVLLHLSFPGDFKFDSQRMNDEIAVEWILV